MKKAKKKAAKKAAPKSPAARPVVAAASVVANDIENDGRCPAFHAEWGRCVKLKGHEGNHARDPRPDCPVPKCEKHRHPNQLMCLAHWRRVPKVNQKAVWDTYAAGPRTLNYCLAADDAIAAVAAKEGNTVAANRTFTQIFFPEHKEPPA